MNFVVKYRNQDGEIAFKTFDAASRSDCCRQLSTCGITPLQIVRANNADIRGEGRRSIWIKLTGILVLVIIVVLMVALLCRNDNTMNERNDIVTDEPTKGAFIQPLKPLLKPEPSTIVHDKVTYQQVKFLTNKDGSKMYLKPGDVVGSNVFETVYGTVRMLEPAAMSGEPPVFKNNVHAMLASYIQPGVDMPPPEHVPDEDALAACIHPIEILEDDSPSVKSEKKIVESMRLELKEYLAQGGNADSYFNKLQQRQEAEAEAVQEIRRHVNELINDDKIEDAVVALKEFNKYLNSKGIPDLSIKRLNRYMKTDQERKEY